MIENLKNILPYNLTLVVTIVSPLILVLYRFWVKSRFDKKLEKQKAELQKEFKKHDIRLNQYQSFYKIIDNEQKDLKIKAEQYSNEVALKSEQFVKQGKLEEALNFKNYLENITELNSSVSDAIHKIQYQANEFRFYASDKLIEYLDELDKEYEVYHRSIISIDQKLLEDSFSKVISGDFSQVINSLIELSQTETKSPSKLQEIHEIHEKIKSHMRKELQLNE